MLRTSLVFYQKFAKLFRLFLPVCGATFFFFFFKFSSILSKISPKISRLFFQQFFQSFHKIFLTSLHNFLRIIQNFKIFLPNSRKFPHNFWKMFSKVSSIFLTCFMFLLWPTLLMFFLWPTLLFSCVLQATSPRMYHDASVSMYRMTVHMRCESSTFTFYLLIFFFHFIFFIYLLRVIRYNFLRVSWTRQQFVKNFKNSLVTFFKFINILYFDD